jgi:hypothetical protein
MAKVETAETRTEAAVGTAAWFDISSTDLQKSKDFYG